MITDMLHPEFNHENCLSVLLSLIRFLTRLVAMMLHVTSCTRSYSIPVLRTCVSIAKASPQPRGRQPVFTARENKPAVMFPESCSVRRNRAETVLWKWLTYVNEEYVLLNESQKQADNTLFYCIHCNVTLLWAGIRVRDLQQSKRVIRIAH